MILSHDHITFKRFERNGQTPRISIWTQQCLVDAKGTVDAKMWWHYKRSVDVKWVVWGFMWLWHCLLRLGV